MTDSVPSAPGQAPNSVAPARGAPDSIRSRTKGDVPQAVLDRYLVERDARGRAERYFRDHRAGEPLFRDRGGSLVANKAYPDAVADMLKIAQHRGWSRVRVSGDEAFRREVWIQAQALGLEVSGHRPRERDRQAAGTDRPEPVAAREGPNSSIDPLRDRLQRAAVVVARLIPDPAVQARLLERALARAEQDRSPPRSRPRDRDRVR